MDQLTIEHYNQHANTVAELHARLIPARLYQLAQRFFHPAGACLDLGCGMGRDSAWLAAQGYPVLRIDAACTRCGLVQLHSETSLELGRGVQWWTLVMCKQMAAVQYKDEH